MKRRLLGLMLVGAIVVAAPPAVAARLCLTPDVGTAISQSMASHALEGALPPGWDFAGINVWPEWIAIHVMAPGGRPVEVELRARGERAAGADGHGSSFVFFLRLGSVAPSPSERAGLLDLAARVDRAVPQDLVASGCQPRVRHVLRWLEMGANVPRAVALLLGAFEVLVVAAGLVFLAARWRIRRVPSRRFGPFEQIAIFAGGLASLSTWRDPFAALWIDTVNDQRDVIRCLAGGLCTTLGEQTSLRGIWHAAGWLHVRALAAFTGGSVEAVLWLFHLLDGAAVLLVACAVCRGVGRRAGALAALGCAVGGFLSANHAALYNCVALPCLGALLLALGTAAAERPTGSALVWLALAAALVANVHISGALAGLSVVAIAAATPGPRWARAALTAAVFVAASFALGPGTWMHAASVGMERVRAELTAHGGAAGVTPAARVCVALLAVCVAGALVARRRRGSQAAVGRAALAIAAPALLAAIGLGTTTGFPLDAKYVAFAAPAVAALAAILLDAVLGPLARPPAILDRVLPFAAAVAAAWVPAVATGDVFPASIGAGEKTHPLAPRLALRDVAPLPAQLSAQRFTYAQAYRSIKSPVAADILQAFELIAPDFPTGAAGETRRDEYVLKAAADRLPQPLPPGWSLLRRYGRSATVLVSTGTALDWDRFVACDPVVQRCWQSGLALHEADKPQCPWCVEGLPVGRRPGHRTLVLRLPIRATEVSAKWAIVMPRSAQFCEGRITRIKGADAVVSELGDRAEWTSSTDPAQHAEADIEWNLGAQRCPPGTYDGFPPFFLEGEAEVVERLERLVDDTSWR